MIVSTYWVRAVEHPARGRHKSDTKMTTYHTSAFYSPIAKASKKQKICPERPAMWKKYRLGCGHATPNAHLSDLFLLSQVHEQSEQVKYSKCREPGREQ